MQASQEKGMTLTGAQRRNSASERRGDSGHGLHYAPVEIESKLFIMKRQDGRVKL
jgi:hypothetical protein